MVKQGDQESGETTKVHSIGFINDLDPPPVSCTASDSTFCMAKDKNRFFVRGLLKTTGCRKCSMQKGTSRKQYNAKKGLAGFEYAVQADGTILAERRWRE
jgi:hypothetical protein